MNLVRVIVVMLIASVSAGCGETAFRAIDDQKHGYALRHPKEWRSWPDSDEKCHLTLRSADDHIMVFVLSETFDPAFLPRADESLSDWGRRTFVRDDPKVRVESVAVDRSLFQPSAAVSLVMRQDDGSMLKSETYAFTRYPSDGASRRVWKVFAIFDPALVTPEELDGWREIKASLKISRF